MNTFTLSTIKQGFTKFLAISVIALGSTHAKTHEVGSTEYKLQAAEVIDKLVAKVFEKQKLPVPKQVDDAKFLRRSYLVLTGRIPTLNEVVDFTASNNPYKRDILVQQLINSPGYNSHTTNYFFDLLRVKETFNNNNTASPYHAWIRDAVRTNKKWHQIVTELVSAKGSVWKNGAIGYYARDKGMELDNMANSMRLFMGTRMECAQCHDHPYNAKIDRMDFYRLAAFSSGFKEINTGAFYKIEKALRDKEERSSYSSFVRFMKENVAYTSRQGMGSGRIKLPTDYQYNDGDPHEYVGARTPIEKSVRMSDRRDGDDGIKRFSKWMTSDNRRFTSVITNRLWKRIMGTGIFEPEDDYIEADKTVSPELMKFLSKLMLDLDYDMKAFQHILLLTKTYGFETSVEQVRATSYNLHGRQLRRLSAEQIWDSFVTLKAGNPDKLPLRQYPKTLTYRGNIIGVGSENMEAISAKILSTKDPAALDAYLKGLHASLKSSKSQPMMMKTHTSKALTGFVRASEISSPAPLGHMLREFGQSDRELIQNSTEEPNVNQVLSILNGHVEKLIVSDKKAFIYQAISKESSVEENITKLFLATLTRNPSKVELIIFKEEVAQAGDAGYQNILAALLTSREFLFIQ